MSYSVYEYSTGMYFTIGDKLQEALDNLYFGRYTSEVYFGNHPKDNPIEVVYHMYDDGEYYTTTITRSLVLFENRKVVLRSTLSKYFEEYTPSYRPYLFHVRRPCFFTYRRGPVPHISTSAGYGRYSRTINYNKNYVANCLADGDTSRYIQAKYRSLFDWDAPQRSRQGKSWKDSKKKHQYD